MRASAGRRGRGAALGWLVVGAYLALLLAVALPAALDSERRVATGEDAVQQFAAAWERSLRATFVRTGVFERRSEVSGQRIASEDVLVQRPPRRLHRQLGGVEGRDDDRAVLCPAPLPRQESPGCSLGAAGGLGYEELIERGVAGVLDAVGGSDPLYEVVRGPDGCFSLDLRRADPRASFGVASRFCFDEETGAPTDSTVRYEGGVVETITVTALRGEVSDADLEP